MSRFDQTVKQFQEEEKSLEVTQKVSVIKVGNKLMVTVPAKWAKLAGINKGDKLVFTLCKGG